MTAMNTNLQNAFRALADPTRRQILLHLSQDDMTIGDISKNFDMTRAAVKKHLVMLEEGRLISVRQNGRERINRLEPAGLKSVTQWLKHFDQFWDTKLSNLTNAIEAHQNTNKDTQND